MSRYFVEARTAYGRTIFAVVDSRAGYQATSGLYRGRTVARCDRSSDAQQIALLLERATVASVARIFRSVRDARG